MGAGLKLKQATQAEMEAATSQAAIITPANQNNHPSAVKAWANFNGTGVSTRASYNVSSITRHLSLTGQFIVTWDNDFSAADYAVVMSAGYHQGVTTDGGWTLTSDASGSVQTGSIRLHTRRGSTDYDADHITCIAVGDQ